MASLEYKHDEEAFLPKGSSYENDEQSDIILQPKTKWKSYLRTGFEIVMGVVIILLLLRPQLCRTTSKTSPVPKRMFWE